MFLANLALKMSWYSTSFYFIFIFSSFFLIPHVSQNLPEYQAKIDFLLFNLSTKQTRDYILDAWKLPHVSWNPSMADWGFTDVIVSDATNQSTSSHEHKGRSEEILNTLTKARK